MPLQGLTANTQQLTALLRKQHWSADHSREPLQGVGNWALGSGALHLVTQTTNKIIACLFSVVDEFGS